VGWAIAGIVALGAVLRLWGSNVELWFDELISLQFYVRLPLAGIVREYAANNHVLNSVLAHGAVATLGEEPWVLRLPALLFGIAGVWMFAILALHLWPRTSALAGAVLFAISYPHVAYTQNARGYSAFVFFAMLATWALLRMLRESDATKARLFGISYVAAIGLGAFALLLMLFVIAGHFMVLVATRRWNAVKWLLGGMALATVLYAPAAPQVIRYYVESPGATGHALFSSALLAELEPILAPLLVGLPFGAFLAIRLARRDGLACALLLVPLAFNVALPALRGQGVHPRSFILALPVGHLLLVEALDALGQRSRRLVGIAVVAGCLASLAFLLPFYGKPKQGFRAALDWVQDHRRSGDRVIGLTLGGKALRFYDPSVALVEGMDDLERELAGAEPTVWVLYTFRREMQSSSPELWRWVTTSTDERAVVDGVLGDAEVWIHAWPHTTRVPIVRQ
jgi:hypothetical protein